MAASAHEDNRIAILSCSMFTQSYLVNTRVVISSWTVTGLY
jgi:hypothetical protein